MGTFIPYDRDVFQRRLRMLRKENGFTQPSFAEHIGKTKGAIGHWEAGNREPGLGMVYSFAKIFGVSLDYMLGTSDFRNEDEAIHYLLTKIREAGLVNENDELDKKTIDKLMAYIEAINEIKRN